MKVQERNEDTNTKYDDIPLYMERGKYGIKRTEGKQEKGGQQKIYCGATLFHRLDRLSGYGRPV